MSDFPPTPNAVPAFMCGDDGCQVEYRDPEVVRRVDLRRRAWAYQRMSEVGEFPGFEEQVDFVVRVTKEEEEAARRRAMMRETP